MRSLFLILFLLLSVPVTASPIEEGWHIEFETPSPFVGESYAQEFSVVLLTPYSRVCLDCLWGKENDL